MDEASLGRVHDDDQVCGVRQRCGQQGGAVRGEVYAARTLFYEDCRRDVEMTAEGRTVVVVAIDGRASAVIGISDAPRPTARAAVEALQQQGVEVVMLTGDNRTTAERIARELGIREVMAEVLPADKASKIGELQQAGKKVAMVGDGVNDAPALAQADVGIAIGAGTDVAIETADIVLMRSDPLDVATAITIGRATLRKMRQNLGWAVGYNAIAIPIAAGIFEPRFGLVLRPEIAALSMSGSSLLVAINALLLKRLKLAADQQRGDRRRHRPTLEDDRAHRRRSAGALRRRVLVRLPPTKTHGQGHDCPCGFR